MLNLNNVEEFSPCILKINNAIEEVEEIISKAKSRKENFYDSTFGGGIVKKDVRNSVLIDISPSFSNDKFWWIFAQKLWQAGDFYGKKYGVSFSIMEDPQFLWYKKNQGFYVPHVDAGNNPRVFSLVLYLNNVEFGGETYFEHLNISFKPEAGTMILFPANFAYLHGAKTPISNDKNVVVTWFHS